MKKIHLLIVIVVSLGFAATGALAETEHSELSETEFFYGISFDKRLEAIKPQPEFDPVKSNGYLTGSIKLSPSEFFYSDSIPDPIKEINLKLNPELQKNREVTRLSNKDLSSESFY